VRVVFKNLVVHPQYVTDAHHAGCAAAKQGKFVEFKDAFWEKAFKPYQEQRDPTKLNTENIMVIAKDVGLDPGRLKSDMDSADCKQVVEGDMAELAKFRVNSTPTFFINGKHINGALGKDEFKRVIDDRLKIAEASGVSGADYYEKEVMGKGEKQFRSKVDGKN
jgi:predicted DsbA family dithiol-disulfide isomerase